VHVAFNKFDPYREDADEGGLEATNPSARRRALVLRYAWWIATAYTAVGFAFILYWLLT